MTGTNALPFELTPESVENWLVTLNSLSMTEKINQLNRMITLLQNSPNDAGRLLSVLEKLTETVLMVSNVLERTVTGDKNDGLSDRNKKIAAFAVQLPKKLCYVYCKMANDDALEQAGQALCFYRALQIISLLIKRNTLFYEVPDFSFWRKAGELYSAAQSKDLLTSPVDRKMPGLAYQPNSEAVIKQALLFYIGNPYPYSTSDIADIFSAMGNLAHLVGLDREPSDFTFCYWNPDSSVPPRAVNPETREPGALYINISKLMEHVEGNGGVKPESFQTFASIFSRLTAYSEIRRSVDPAKQAECGLIIGTAQAARFINALISRYRILELSGADQPKSQSAQLELVPLESGKDAMAFLSTKILNDDKSLAVAKINIYRTDKRAFCTSKIGSLDCSIDEPGILLFKNQKPLFAIIRHIRTETGISLKNILIEIIDGDVYPIETEDNGGFFVDRPSGKTEMFLPRGIHNTDSGFFIEKGLANRTFKIEKFIELTAHFMRFQVSPC